MLYVAIVVGVLVVAFVGFVFWARTSGPRSEEAMRKEIDAYVTSKGGKVTFDDANGMTIEGTRASGHEKLTALRIMLSSKSGDRALTLGFALRKYFPDKFDEVFEKNAQARLAESKDAIAKLSGEELRTKARIEICSARSSATGLATCARALFDGYEARVVLDGFELQGIPTAARATIGDDDAALFEAALSQTLGLAPAFSAGAADHLAWLAAPGRIFGTEIAVVAAVGKTLAWIAPTADPTRALATLAGRSMETGPLKAVLLAWDGTSLTRIPTTVHTIKGPTTPDYTLELPPAIRDAFGVTADERGQIGVSR